MRYVILSALFVASLCAQGPPNCTFTATFSSATPGTAFANKATSTGGFPCLYWEFTYWTNGASGVSVKLEGTNDSSGSAGASFTALTAAQGTSNPATGTNQGAAVMCCDYYPWLRVNPTTFTGTSQAMTVRVYGWFTQPVNAGGSAVGPNVNVAQWGGTATSLGQKVMASSVPVAIASDQSTLAVGGLAAAGAAPASNPIPLGYLNSAGNLQTPDYCTSKATVSGATLITGSTQLVAVSGSTTIRICKISFTTDTLSTFQLVTGTGATCTSPTVETAVYSGAGGGLFGVIEDYASPLVTTAAKTLCVSLSAGVTTTGGVTIEYSQR